MTEKVFSQESGVAPYETLFHDFNFEAYSFFNYWTLDETTNDTLELENRDVNTMPRFVKLVWDTAPDLPEQKLAYDKMNPPNKNSRNSTVGVGTPGSRDTYIVDGVEYSPQQLEPSDFSQIVNALANSDIAPGVISSVVSLPLVSAGVTPAAPAYSVDLDSWYSSPSSNGTFISDVRGTFNNRASGYFNLPQIYSDGVSAKNTAVFNELFNGNFSVAQSSYVNPKINLTTVNASSSALSVNANPATTTRPPVPSPSRDLFGQIVSSPSSSIPTVNSVRVNFIDTGIGNVVSPVRVNAATDPAHANSIAATAQVLGNLVSYSASGLQSVTRKITLKSFPAPAIVAAKQYVGYIIEKYEMNMGVFQFKQLISIGDPYADEYYDTKVRYGGIYYYRIRSVIRWSRPSNVNAWGTDPTIVGQLFSTSSHSNTSSTTLTPNQVSYFGGEWNKRWASTHIIDDQAPNPPDQLEVRPQSNKKNIVVTWQLPENEQRDIFEMRLYRRVVDADGSDVISWSMIADYDMSRPGYFEDDSVEFQPQFPDPKQLGFNPTLPLRYVYAVSCVSVHNGESVLSEQIGAHLNREWQQKGEFSVEFFSSRGVNWTHDHGVFSTIPIKKFKTHIVVVPQNTFDGHAPAVTTIKCQQRWGSRILPGNNYILRIHSLDNGETFDVDFVTNPINLEPQKIQAPSNIYVPSANEQYVYNSQALTSG